MEGAALRIAAAVGSWSGSEAHPHRFGGTEPLPGPGDRPRARDALVDLPFPVRLRDELITAGRAEPHHILPETGWVSRHLRLPEDVEAAIALFRLQYERLVAGAAPPAAPIEPPPSAR